MYGKNTTTASNRKCNINSGDKWRIWMDFTANKIVFEQQQENMNGFQYNGSQQVFEQQQSVACNIELSRMTLPGVNRIASYFLKSPANVF